MAVAGVHGRGTGAGLEAFEQWHSVAAAAYSYSSLGLLRRPLFFLIELSGIPEVARIAALLATKAAVDGVRSEHGRQ